MTSVMRDGAGPMLGQFNLLFFGVPHSIENSSAVSA